MIFRLFFSVFQAATTNDEEDGSGADNDDEEDLEVSRNPSLFIFIVLFFLFRKRMTIKSRKEKQVLKLQSLIVNWRFLLFHTVRIHVLMMILSPGSRVIDFFLIGKQKIKENIHRLKIQLEICWHRFVHVQKSTVTKIRFDQIVTWNQFFSYRQFIRESFCHLNRKHNHRWNSIRFDRFLVQTRSNDKFQFKPFHFLLRLLECFLQLVW